MSEPSPETVMAAVDALVSGAEFGAASADLLLRLCAVDTTPGPDVAAMRAAEAQVFGELGAVLAVAGAATEFRAVDPAIARHPAYSPLHFTKTPACPGGLPAEQAYAGRGNLLARLAADPGAPAWPGRRPALNAHVDVVAPFISPRREGGRILGRGANDDKASCVAMVQAAAVIAELRRRGLVRLARPVLMMFVVEEETGGNGSLSLACDPVLRGEYDSLLVLECTDLRLHPANRGAVWYRAGLRTSQAPVLGAAVEAILAMEAEGARIRAESDHPLFPHRPVQTCHGILGPFGAHPSRICGEVAVEIATGMPVAELERLLRQGLDGYVAAYGDKTLVTDPQTGLPKVARHYRLSPMAPGRHRLEVFGATGHMGSIRENDGAITKLAWMLRSVIAGAPDMPELAVPGVPLHGPLVLEGGQGFLPTHPIAAVMARISQAATDGVRAFADRTGDPAAECAVSFEKLHNNAFAGDPEAPTVHAAARALERLGRRCPGDPILGWDVSCDARLFADERPGLPVITCGPGKLRHAHADDEQVDLADLLAAIRFAVLFILFETGSLPVPGLPADPERTGTHVR